MAKSTMTVTLKTSLKLSDGQIVPAGKIFRGELNEFPEWLQLELKLNSRVLEVERLRIPDVKKASVTEIKKDSLITETQKESPAEIDKEYYAKETVPELEKKLGKKILKPLKDIASKKSKKPEPIPNAKPLKKIIPRKKDKKGK